jgi:hypothetical protein
MNPRVAVSADQLYEIAAVLVPYLTRDELRAVWDRLKTSPCSARLGVPQRTWLELITAIGERDAGNMVELAGKLLGQDAGHKEYLLSAAVTGHLALNEREQAIALWRKYADKMVSAPNDMLPDLLRGHLFWRFSAAQGLPRSIAPK